MPSAPGLKRVYPDVCALCRPFDDQSAVRIRLETVAIELILDCARRGEIDLIVSPAHDVEIDATTDFEEHSQLVALLEELGTRPRFDLPIIRDRAESLASQGLGAADAAHAAFAEQAHADFVTVDDRLIKRLRRLAPMLWCGTPPAYCEKENLK